jgi:hypothetical protein
MVCFQTKDPHLGKFCRALDWKMLIYFMAIWNILPTFGIFYDHLVCTFCVHLVHFSRFGIKHQEKSGNPAWVLSKKRLTIIGRGTILSGISPTDRAQYLVIERWLRKNSFVECGSWLPEFSWYVQHTKTGKNKPNDRKLYQMAIKYTN